jgi:ankyrin repeat protein
VVIESGADLNARDVYGQTPIMTTVSPGVTQALIESGADLAIKDHYGFTVLHYAKHLPKYSDQDMVQFVNVREASLAARQKLIILQQAQTRLARK